MRAKTILLMHLILGILASTAHAADVTAFLNPDNSYTALDSFIENSSELKIASYTFTSADIAKELIGSGINTTILIDASPAGGLPGKEVLCELVRDGIAVYLYDGPEMFMHAKYIIKGNEVLMSTENFGDDGFPANGYGNRGWGIIVKDEGIADQLSAIFDEDMTDAHLFACDLDNYTIKYGKTDGLEPVSSPITYSNQGVELITAPDAVQPVLDLIGTAQESLYIEQFYVYRYWDRQTESPNLFLEAAINKARQGVDVRILLDSYWYNVEEDDPASNLHTFEYVNQVAAQENLSLEARLADLSAIGVEKLHIKGVVIDGETAFVSSINWNENSPRNNRETGMVVSGDSASYFADAFMRDWDADNENAGYIGDGLFLGLIIVAVVAIIIIIFVRRK